MHHEPVTVPINAHSPQNISHQMSVKRFENKLGIQPMQHSSQQQHMTS
jgi:hypothetical protein